MKKSRFLIILALFSLTVSFGQIDINGNQLSSFPIPNNTLIPSTMSPSKLNVSDIPSELVLQQLGFSNEEISELLDYKYGTGEYTAIKEDTNSTVVPKSIRKLYTSLKLDSLIDDSIIFPRANIYGQDIFRNNKLSFYQKALDAKAPENYKVGVGDEISISVWGYSEFSENMIVDSRGYISPSSYGRIYVKGLTFNKMRSLIKSRFSSFLDMKNSDIDVTLSYSRVITVNIVGEVYNPGSYNIPAINTAFNALIAANGPTQIGSVRSIYIKRNGEIVDSLDIYKFLFNPDKTQDIYLEDGDYIFVPPARNTVEVSGAINRPYTYEFKSGESVSDLVKYAGGFDRHAFIDILTLKRVVYNDIKVNDVHKDDFHLTSVKNGDKIVVNSISNKLSNVVSVRSSIGVEGDYEFIFGETLLGLLHRSKCISQKTFLKKVYIIRLNDDRTKSHIAINLEEILNDKTHKDNILLKEHDIVRVLSVEDFDEEFHVIIKGAVRSPRSSYIYGDGMSLQDVLLQAGGITQKAKGSRIEVARIMDYDTKSNTIKPIRAVVKKIKIDDNLEISLQAQNFLLQPFDQIFVRENPDYEEPRNILISGEVKYPGTYALLSRDEKISSIISRAGGLTNSAHVDGVKLYRNKNLQLNDIDATIEKTDIPEWLIDSLSNNNGSLIKFYDKGGTEYNLREFQDTSKIIADYEVISFEMKKALSKNNSRHNIILFQGDHIVVPEELNVVHIKGALNNLESPTISSPYFGKRAHFYVNNFAGGYSLDNKKSSTIVIHPNGSIKRTINFGLFSLSPKIKSGSTIKVINKSPKNINLKEEVDYNRHIESVIVKITGLISLSLLIERLNNGF